MTVEFEVPERHGLGPTLSTDHGQTGFAMGEAKEVLW